MSAIFRGAGTRRKKLGAKRLVKHAAKAQFGRSMLAAHSREQHSKQPTKPRSALQLDLLPEVNACLQVLKLRIDTYLDCAFGAMAQPNLAATTCLPI